MNLSSIGWFVVHSTWECTLIAGATAMILSVLPDRRTRTRYVVACASLAVMALVAIGTAFTGVAGLRSILRAEVVYAVDDAIGLSTLISWRIVIVPAAGVLWLVGIGICLVNTGFAWRRVRVLRRRGLSDPGRTAHDVAAALREQMALRGAVELRMSAEATVPMVLGSQRPLVLLPARTVNTLTAVELRAVLAHELAHVRRYDHAVNLVLIIAEILLFHHPAARWAARRVRTEREYCCDDVAVSMADPNAYGRALAALEDTRAECRLVVAAAAGTLLDRIQRIAGQPRPMMTPARGAIALVGRVRARRCDPRGDDQRSAIASAGDQDAASRTAARRLHTASGPVEGARAALAGGGEVPTAGLRPFPRRLAGFVPYCERVLS